MAAEYRDVTLVRIQRNAFGWKRPGNPGTNYGHWWLEIGDPLDPGSESYGWWPAAGVDLKQTLAGVAGILNARIHPARDPHHGEDAEIEFYPRVRTDDSRTDEQIADCLRSFARSFQGKWQWFFELGQNCHTFQKRALEHCGLIEPE